jgi:hypothetical protein
MHVNGRIRTLERLARSEAGCRVCQGRLVAGVTGENDDVYPPWVDASGRCRGCGNHIKLYPQEQLDRLA